ncbi:MAG: class I adenylate-forming enzyme family protein [Acidimicrobiaceae bacterium]|nr:class I adenylate-forming enzyme family protein [Acidimicrobiaceae bacterium]
MYRPDIVSVFRRTARRHGERPFLIDSLSSVTYAEAERITDAAAAELVARGVSPGDTVGFCAPDQVSLWLGIIGAWKAGALPALLDAQLSADALPYFVEDVDAPVVAAAVERHEVLAAAGARSVIDLNDLAPVDAATAPTQDPDPVDRHGPDAPLYLSYTSGTTGLPKGVVLHSADVTRATSCIADRLGLCHDDVLLATTPIPSSCQLVAALMPAVHTGAAVALVAGRPVAEMWQVARANRATVLVAYPLTLADIVNAPDAADDPPFRVALSGGSPLAPRIKRDYLSTLGISLLESYGQSEMGGFMAMGSPADGERALEGWVGRPLPDRSAYVAGLDEPFDELPAGQVGEVLVGHGFFPEYRNKPDRFADTTQGGVLHTGDLAVADPDGYMMVLGRTNEAASAAARGGFLRQLEDALYSHPAVLHAAVVDRGDGELAGFYETRSGQAVTPEDLIAHAGATVPAALLPATMTELEAMPRTFSGKADRLGLAHRAAGAG